MTVPSRILVIKLGALGDFAQAIGPFVAIRRHHPGARISLLTTPPLADFARAGGWFDEVRADGRPAGFDLAGWIRLRAWLRGGDFARVYDLQTSDRSAFYFRLFLPGAPPEWSGIARGCSHPHANPRRDFMHTLERQAEQLRMAGIPEVPPPDLSWVRADLDRFGLPDRFALLVPGGAPHRPAKRWPAENFAALARRLAERGIVPLLLGVVAERSLIAAIGAACPVARPLAGATTVIEVAALARAAAAAIGNDTGPMHLAAIAGCPSVVLYSAESDPALCAQRGPRVAILRRPRLADLPVEDVLAALAGLGG